MLLSEFSLSQVFNHSKSLNNRVTQASAVNWGHSHKAFALGLYLIYYGSPNCFVYTPKNYHLFKVVENRMQQCCAAHIVHSCQQYCSALLSLNQPAIRCNNAEQYC